MARARNIKPGFYANEDLAECSIWARFIFPGLWMMADREGRLEYRPKKIKGELLRFDTVEAEPLLQELEHYGFILIYEAQGARYIQIIKFAEHQNPHYKEAPSTIPAPDGWADGLGIGAHSSEEEPGVSGSIIDDDAPGIGVDDEEENPGFIGQSSANDRPMIGGQTGLIPDSGFLIPDSVPKPRSSRDDLAEPFAEFWRLYPRKVSKAEAEKAYRKLKPDIALQAALLAAVATQSRSHDWSKDEGRFIPHASTWLNQRRWEDQVIPAGGTVHAMPSRFAGAK